MDPTLRWGGRGRTTNKLDLLKDVPVPPSPRRMSLAAYKESVPPSSMMLPLSIAEDALNLLEQEAPMSPKG